MLHQTWCAKSRVWRPFTGAVIVRFYSQEFAGAKRSSVTERQVYGALKTLARKGVVDRLPGHTRPLIWRVVGEDEKRCRVLGIRWRD